MINFNTREKNTHCLFRKKNCQKNIPHLIKMVDIDKYWVKTKTKNQLLLKIWKKNENIKGIAIENKTGQEKSICVVCDSKKSTF